MTGHTEQHEVRELCARCDQPKHKHSGGYPNTCPIIATWTPRTTPTPAPDSDLLTQAAGNISAALIMAGKEDKIAAWTAPYVEAINRADPPTPNTEPAGRSEAVDGCQLAPSPVDDHEPAGGWQQEQVEAVRVRVAKALASHPDSSWDDYEWQDMPSHVRETFLEQADLALAALTQPSGERPEKAS